MGKIWNLVRSRSEVRGNLLLTAVIASTAILAFCWGRHGALSNANAQGVAMPGQPQIPKGNYDGRVVAFIHGNIPITREELGEYLIARFGPERVDFLVNRRIIEHACARNGITVSDAEVDAQLKEDLKAFGKDMDEKRFVTEVLKRYNKSLYEWREDVIRPRLALSKFCQGQIKVTEEDAQKRFEALYGEMVECKMIILPSDFRQAAEVWQRISNNKEAFEEEAKKQPIRELAARAGAIPPIHKHFGDPKLEEEAFKLKNPGDISPLLGMQDKSQVILQMVKRIPPNTTKQYPVERVKLFDEVREIKLSQEIPKIFQNLRTQANPTILMRREFAAEQDRQAQGVPGVPPMPTTGAPRGN
ncbi:MAG TPA: hypothetical protein VEL76_36900 [Gemmataceae bacterium]|nr:hypothetical protein [Gemmataceae bacterium]